MRVALYARVSTRRQAQAQTVEQQLERLRGHTRQQGWDVPLDHIFRDDGYGGASLRRPGLDRLRDRAAARTLDLVVITAPDRAARNYVHQVLLLEELEGHGYAVRFLDRPMSHDPHDQLLLQIRGAVAEYERTLISERMRRGCKVAALVGGDTIRDRRLAKSHGGCPGQDDGQRKNTLEPPPPKAGGEPSHAGGDGWVAAPGCGPICQRWCSTVNTWA
jgi:DNA invertase Pin-like site-specific DNA recombinase